MSSWLYSWLPTIPSINIPLPSSVQARFISFALKRSLGHLFKPGQLDTHKIDSQIGSGYVQISDIELNTEEVNGFLSSLPVELSDGYVSSVTAHIPWPSPLTSNIGLSFDSLNLTFVLNPAKATPLNVGQSLSDSVLSVADTFLHDELTPQEEANLRKSLDTDPVSIDDSNSLPGGLDPFILPTNDDEMQSDRDLAGVSIFTVLIERLLARFQLDAVKTTITLIYPDECRITINISNISYRAVFDSSASEGLNEGGTRTVSISGINVLAANLKRPKVVHSSRSMSSPSSIASSSSSSLDEDTQFAMSQSLAFLPPRSASPTNSVASSMYHSAISDTAGPCNKQGIEVESGRAASTDSTEVLEHELLRMGSDPVVIHLKTPSFHEGKIDGMSSFDFFIELGHIAVAFRPCHIPMVHSLITALRPSQSSSNVTLQPEPNSIALSFSINVRLHLKSFAVLILPSHIPEQRKLELFFAHPSSLPRFSQNYLRFLAEDCNLSLLPTPAASTSLVEPTFSVKDFSFYEISDSPSMNELHVSPLLITDSNLSENTQYQKISIPLPSFKIIDWTDEKLVSTKIRHSQWRSPIFRRPATSYSSEESHVRSDLNTDSQVHPPAIMVTTTQVPSVATAERNRFPLSTQIDVKISPLHLFLDLKLLKNNVLRDIIEESQNFSQSVAQNNADALFITPPGTPKLGGHLSHSDNQYYQKSQEDKNKIGFVLDIPMIRLQIRTPSPRSTERRSGVVVLDFHNFCLRSVNSPSRIARFHSLSDDDHTGHPQWIAECRRIVASYGHVKRDTATAILSLASSHPSSNELRSADADERISLSASLGTRAATSLAISVPSLYATIDKLSFDGLQYWADDLTEWIAECVSDSENVTSRANSLLGSQYLDSSTSGNSLASTEKGHLAGAEGQTHVVASLREALITLCFDEASPAIQAHVLESILDFGAGTNRMGESSLSFSMGNLTVKTLDSNHVASILVSAIPGTSVSSKAGHVLSLLFVSAVAPRSGKKRSKIKLCLCGLTWNLSPPFDWATGLATFAKAPPGAFELVVPSESTMVDIKLLNTSLQLVSMKHPGAVVLHTEMLNFSTLLEGDDMRTSFSLLLSSVSLLAVDNRDSLHQLEPQVMETARAHWKSVGFALITEMEHFSMTFRNDPSADSLYHISVDDVSAQLHLCADTLSPISSFIQAFISTFSPPTEEKTTVVTRRPKVVSESLSGSFLLGSVEDLSFKQQPAVGPAPDLVQDDLPTNPDYLELFSGSAGLRELREDDMEEFDTSESIVQGATDVQTSGLVSRIGGETIRLLDADGLRIVEHHFDMLTPEVTTSTAKFGKASFSLMILNANINVFLYDGYDWARTRKTIEEGIKEMRKKLAKIRQLVASGQVQDPTVEETSALLYNSVYIGLDQDVDALDPGALISAIDDELMDEDDDDNASQSSWQSLKHSASGTGRRRWSDHGHAKRLIRAKGPSMEFRISQAELELDQYLPNEMTASRIFAVIRNFEILDHIGTSTWRKFLTDLHHDSRGNVRETDSNMVKVELLTFRPVAGDPSEEARLKAKILPLRLYVDQDALDFLKKFFNFRDPETSGPSANPPNNEIYFQHAEIFPIDLKLDYKPRRVDYRALRDGRTIELMNFFHFDGAEMTLRHITLSGVTGWPRLFDLLNDIWTPDVKATQLVDVISGVSPIRSVVNVGSGIADLVLLPIAQYKKDGRVVRGVQKGAQAFVKSTATEAIKLGARLATGTQVILEQAEGLFAGQLNDTITTEAVQVPAIYRDDFDISDEEEDIPRNLISRYAQQPVDIKEGVQSAYKSIHRNFTSAAQTILAVPMQVYERSDQEGPVRSVIRAVPIAVLKPMIGATEAVSKTLLGLHNTLDPDIRHDNEAKYKH